MESKKINQLATELTPALDDLTIIGDPTTGISKKITLSQMASLFTGTVEEYANLASFPLVGTADTIYIALDTNVIYRWNTGTSAYVELSPNIVTSLVFSDANGFDGTISLVGSTATLTITTALTTGSVPFIGASGALSQDNANLFFDDTNNRLGVNTNVPTAALDVFGSGIIGRLNGTSTNNAYLGFASAGTNQWSIGNVQSDQRFRIYSEANTSELVSVLQTGEFGIGIANPTTKLHIDGGASALIANLDANVSVAKSISFRSDNSNRINLEVSGTESGSNAGADLFIRRYSDAGALIDTPLTITRSTGNTTFLNNVGIGIAPTITASVTELAVGSSATNPRISGIRDGVNAFSIYSASTGTDILERRNLDLRLGANNTTNLTLASTGSSTFSGTLNINTDSNIIRFGNLLRWGFQRPAADNRFISFYRTLHTTGTPVWTVDGDNGNFGIGTTAPAFPLEAYINSSTAYTTSSRGNAMRVYNPNTGSNIYAGIEFGGAGAANDGLAGINAVVTGSGSAALTFYTRDSNTFSEKLRIAPSGSVIIGSNANSADTSLLTIKQASTSYNNGIYLERGSERNGYFMYIGGAVDSLTFRRNYFGTQSDVMSLTRDGNVGIGLTNPARKLDVYADGIKLGDGGSFLFDFNVGGSSGYFINFAIGASNIFRIRGDGYIASPTTYNNTTATGANLSISTSGFIERSTSSIRYKTNVEDLTIDTTNILSKMRPIWYRSLGQNDRKDWSWYGFIAEELAEIEPRLVHWGYDSTSYETIEIKDEEGNIKEETKLKEDAELIPDGVQYERITVFLVAELQKMRKELDALKAK